MHRSSGHAGGVDEGVILTHPQQVSTSILFLCVALLTVSDHIVLFLTVVCLSP